VSLLPPTITLLVGRYALRMNGALLLGAVTGSMTSTPALTQVNKLAGNNVPMLGYVGTYTFANVLLAVAGAAVARLI
jgi:putative transport protein